MSDINSIDFFEGHSNPEDKAFLLKTFGAGSVFDVRGYEGKNITNLGGQRMGGVGEGEGDTKI